MRDIIYNANGETGAKSETGPKGFDAQAGIQAGQSLINLGLGIKQSREASGAAEFRRQKKALCGRKPLIGFGKKFRKRKEDYKKCVSGIVESQQNLKNAPVEYYPDVPQSTGFNMKYVYIGIAVLAVAGIAIFVIKRQNK